MTSAVAKKKLDLEIRGPISPEMETVLTDEALAFVAELARDFSPRVDALLARRKQRQRRIDAGTEKLGFLEDTADVRAGDWKVAPLPLDLKKRRVEITGPVSAKMVINALNSGADVFMADFEDASCPTWQEMVLGQKNLMEAVRGALTFRDEKKGKDYALNDETAVLMVRPRGWHLPELHVWLDGHPIPGSLFDFGLYFFHNAKQLLENGSGPYFYLPKLEGHLEARLWNDVFLHAQRMLDVPRGTIKATVLIETLPAVFEMDEILYELRDHMAGLNCGRWDYIFSFIKTQRKNPAALTPDRAQIGMTQPAMRKYTQLVVRTCHSRGAFAMGGMAAQIPIKGDDEANQVALDKVTGDKLREATDGHDGTWVAHPGLVPLAMKVFEEQLEGRDNQLEVVPLIEVTAEELLEVPTGTRTEDGVRENLRVGIQYLEAWLRGVGCVPLYNLMEDAATAEISRAQLWQWRHHKAELEDGRVVDDALLEQLADEEMERVSREVGLRFEGGRYREARELFLELVKRSSLPDFLTTPAYKRLVDEGL
jgi:malate synthase